LRIHGEPTWEARADALKAFVQLTPGFFLGFP
jgi:hypothetical protein